MADRYLVASGSILDPANLDGGVALAVGDVLCANGFTGIIDGDTPSILKITINPIAPALAGGVFKYATGGILNADVEPPAGTSGTRTLNCDNTVIWAVLNGSVTGGGGSTNQYRQGINQTGGNLIVNGKSTGGSFGYNSFGPSHAGIAIHNGRLDIMDVDGGSVNSNGGNSPAGVARLGGLVYVHGRAKSAVCEAVTGGVEEVAIVETVNNVRTLLNNGNASGGPIIVTDKVVLNKSTVSGFGGSNWKFSGIPKIDIVFGDNTTASLSTNPDSTIDPSDVLEGVQFDNNTQTGTLKIVDPVPLANLVGQYITPQVLSAVTTP